MSDPTPCSANSTYANLCAARDTASGDLATAYTQLFDMEAKLTTLTDNLVTLQTTAAPDYSVSGGGGMQSFAKGSLLGIQQSAVDHAARAVEAQVKKIDALLAQIDQLTATLTKLFPYQFISAVPPSNGGACRY